jgi:hypothetical protein
LGGGTTGNELLTSSAGAILLVLLAALGLTIVRIGGLLSEHLFIGMLLVPPVLLKMSSTGYRFVRYYLGDAKYTAKGPPLMVLRLLAPLVILSTVVVFATGVLLLFIGPSSRSTLFPIHKDSFFVWLALTAVHVLGHLAELPKALKTDYDPVTVAAGTVPGRSGRMMALAGAIVLGVVLAVLVIPDFSVWLNYVPTFHGH